MELEIEDDCETVFGCIKAIIVTLYSLFVICVIIRIMYKMHVYTTKRCSFELIPLSSTIMQSLFQLILNVFIMDTKLIISALYSQTLTFGIISTSCSQLCLRIKYPHRSRTAKRYTFIAFSVAQFASLVMYLLTLTDIIPLDCNNWFSVAYLFPMMVMFIYTIASISFGSTLIKILKTNADEVKQEDGKEKNNQILNSPSQSQNDSNNKILRTKSLLNKSLIPEREAAYITQLKRQLQFIEFLFLFTIVVQVTMDVVRTYVLTDYIKCEGGPGERSNEFQAYNDWGQIYLTFYQILQITPCFITPYVFYYIPFKAKKAGGSILFNESQFPSIAIHGDENDDESNNMEGSLDSKFLSENFDFSREENFSQNYENKKKYAALTNQKKNPNTNQQNKNEKSKETPIPLKKEDSNKGNKTLNNKSQNSNKSQRNSDNLTNGINHSTIKSGDQNANNVDSMFVYRNKRNDDTLENIDEYLDRMSIKKDDVDNFGSQSSRKESFQTLQKDKSQSCQSFNSVIVNENNQHLKNQSSESFNQLNKQESKKESQIQTDNKNNN